MRLAARWRARSRRRSPSWRRDRTNRLAELDQQEETELNCPGRAPGHRDRRGDRGRPASAEPAREAAGQARHRGDPAALGAGRRAWLRRRATAVTREHLTAAQRRHPEPAERDRGRDQRRARERAQPAGRTPRPGPPRDRAGRSTSSARTSRTRRRRCAQQLDDSLQELKELRERDLLTESEYRDLQERWGNVFRAGMGAEADPRAGGQDRPGRRWSRNCAARSRPRSRSSARRRRPSGCAWPRRSARAATGPSG